MLFSIVTVCYNAETCIEQTIKSVLSQQRDLFEYIIIDGKSSDRTLSIVNKYRHEIDIIVSEKDKGIYDAMNKAIHIAHGKYINFMNAGDYFVNSNVLSNIALNLGDETPSVFFGNEVQKLDGIFYEVEAKPFYAPPYVKHSMGFNHQCTFVQTSIAQRYPFDLKYKLAADYNMIMTIYKNNGTFKKLALPIAYFDTDGISMRNKKKHDQEIFSIDRPNHILVNNIKVNVRNAIRTIKPFVKRIVMLVDPSFMERKRYNSNRFKKINIEEL